MLPLGPSPTYSVTAQHQRYPALVNTKAPPLYVAGAPRQKKKQAQMKEQIKAPEKIQLSNEEIDSLSDAQFKTLVIRMLTRIG